MAISAGGVTLIGIGGLFVWSGLANLHPLATLHDIVAGAPPALPGVAGAGGAISTGPSNGTQINVPASLAALNAVPPGTTPSTLNGLNIGGY